MRHAFRGIQIDTQYGRADQLVSSLVRSRQKRYTPSISRDAGNMNGTHTPKLNIPGGTYSPNSPQATAKQLQWTVRNCDAQANNWFICEKQSNIATESHTIYRRGGNRRNKSTSSTELSWNGKIHTKGK